MKLLVRALVNALGLWLCIQIVSGISVTGSSEYVWLYYILAGVVLALVNMLIRPIVMILSLPLYILTLGLFFVVVNAAMLGLASWITGIFAVGFHVNGFWAALLGGIVIGIVNVIVDLFLPLKYRRNS
ncbi:phage holin family protein [Actinomycetaceae bacterium L2_0104]